MTRHYVWNVRNLDDEFLNGHAFIVREGNSAKNGPVHDVVILVHDFEAESPLLPFFTSEDIPLV